MCGLAAIFAYGPGSAPVEKNILVAMNERMARRGPDGEGLWLSADARVGLSHRRLAIIDLDDRAAQPMCFAAESGRIHITYNGEIYNFRELRGQLEAGGATFKTSSDTEVLLHLYHRDGAAMAESLRGMFAFAIWDEGKGGLLLGRDPFGIKPLYYMDDGRTITVASQVKAILAGLAQGGRPTPPFDAAAHAGFFLFGHVPEPLSLFKGIRALPAGTTRWIDGDGPGPLKKYFDISAHLSGAGSEGDRDLGALLRDSVAHHLIADVPVGVFLSAGLDSATLAALAAESADTHGAGIDTLTLGFEEFAGTPNDEVALAETVAAACGTRHHSVRVAGLNFADDLDDLLDVMDQPSIDGVNVYFVAKAAHRAGLKVALSGLGGDELFGGYDSFKQIPSLVGAVGWLPGGATVGAALRGLAAPVSGRLRKPKAAGLLEYGTRFGDAYLLRRALYMPWEIANGIDGVMDADMGRAGLAELDVLGQLDACQAPAGAPTAKVAALEMSFYMRAQLLRDADWAGMAHGLEIRVPLVDRALFEGLAGGIGKGHGPSKQAMAQTPRRRLPDAVLKRPKTGFSVPVRDWIQGAGKASENHEVGLRGWAKTVYRAQIRG
ncbi:MAG: asparagine synthase (glutamine-hydrolyzing) [Rhodospirillaceae bacterium]|mgnify:CR=1 FL=1|nr:asparagine synthase (glutamine-hydrolyzing) [Rhodospirillaceae bacterium]